MNTRNSREEFQHIIQSSVFIYIIQDYKLQDYKQIRNVETVKVEFLH